MKNLFSLSALFFILTMVVQGQTVNQWRGPARDGIYPEKNLMKNWPESGPVLLWTTSEIGSGYGSPVISGERVYISGEINRIAHVFAFDTKGNLLWKAANGPEFFGEGYSANFPGARSAPTIFNDLVYVCSGMGRIACFEAASGKEKWAVNMVDDLGGKLNMFGYSESLLVDDTKVYCYPGGKDNNIVALDRLTGKVIWSSKALGDPVSFCSPLMIRLPERDLNRKLRDISSGEIIERKNHYPALDILVTLSHSFLLGINANNGELLWSHKEDSVKLEGEHCNTPIYADGCIYCISGDENGNGAYKIRLSDDGKSITEVWRNRLVRNPLGGFVKIGNQIYTTSDDKKLKVLDTKLGQIVETLPGMKGSLISADNLLFCYTDNGYVNLIDGIGSKLEVTGKFKITKGEKEHFAHPVIANGVLYVRHGNALMAYQIK